VKVSALIVLIMVLIIVIHCIEYFRSLTACGNCGEIKKTNKWEKDTCNPQYFKCSKCGNLVNK
jgi:hypothetical protein